MDSHQDVAMGESNERPYEPFTVEENIQQLNAIDKSIVQLMRHTGAALNALTVPSNSSSKTAPDPKLLDPPAQKEDFNAATDSFLDTLHSVDVRMRRQIAGLEEAGIVKPARADGKDKDKEPVAPPTAPGQKIASLKPTGLGAVGNLDVGWLNSRGDRVERDMEAELWSKAKSLLEKKNDDLRRSRE
jgi:hypothetical protein